MPSGFGILESWLRPNVRMVASRLELTVTQFGGNCNSKPCGLFTEFVVLFSPRPKIIVAANTARVSCVGEIIRPHRARLSDLDFIAANIVAHSRDDDPSDSSHRHQAKHPANFFPSDTLLGRRLICITTWVITVFG